MLNTLYSEGLFDLGADSIAELPVICDVTMEPSAVEDAADAARDRLEGSAISLLVMKEFMEW